MNKKSTVVKVAYKKEWSTKDGQTMHSWHVTMDNGDAGSINTREKKEPWAIGEEAEYTVETREYNGDTYTNIKKVYAAKGGFGGKTWTPDPERETRLERWAKQRVISRQACLNTAASLIASGCGPATVENLTGIADKLEEWAWQGVASKVATIMRPTAAAPTTTNDAQASYGKAPVSVSPQGEEDLPF